MKKKEQKRQKGWKDELLNMNFYSSGLEGANDLSRTYEDNRCYILVMRGYLKGKVASSEATINWHAIEA